MSRRPKPIRQWHCGDCRRVWQPAIGRPGTGCPWCGGRLYADRTPIPAVTELVRCGNCAAHTRAPGGRCSLCLAPVSRTKKQKAKKARPPEVVQRALEKQDRRDFAEYKRSLRRQERQDEGGDPDEDFATIEGEFKRSDAGYPLGLHYPPGRGLRDDGETHREAWQRVCRGDPCAYCGEPVSGTLDHIEPQNGPHAKPGAHVWLNYTGACPTCNNSKADEKLLLWLRRRLILPAPANGARRGKTPSKARRLEMERAQRARAA